MGQSLSSVEQRASVLCASELQPFTSVDKDSLNVSQISDLKEKWAWHGQALQCCPDPCPPRALLSLTGWQQPGAEVALLRVLFNEEQHKAKAGKRCRPSAGALPWGGQGRSCAGCGLAHAQSVARAAAASGAPHSVFGCTEQAPRAGTPRRFCVGSVAWLCTGSGSRQAQTDPGSLLGRAGPGCGALFVSCVPQVRVGCAPLEQPPLQSWHRGCSQPALNGDPASHPDLVLCGTPTNCPGTQSSCCAPEQPEQRSALSGGLFLFGPARGTRPSPGGSAPHTKPQSLGCVCVTVPPPPVPVELSM